jgi:hypothetical protein
VNTLHAKREPSRLKATIFLPARGGWYRYRQPWRLFDTRIGALVSKSNASANWQKKDSLIKDGHCAGYEMCCCLHRTTFCTAAPSLLTFPTSPPSLHRVLFNFLLQILGFVFQSIVTGHASLYRILSWTLKYLSDLYIFYNRVSTERSGS